MKKCRSCKKVMRERKKGDIDKRVGLCSSCYAFDKKWVKQGIKFSGIKKTLSQ